MSEEDKKNKLSKAVLSVKNKSKKAHVEFFQKFSENVQKGIKKKSELSGISESTLYEIFSRGMNAWDESKKVSQEQYAFARINSFLNKGRVYFNEDSDLINEKKEPKPYEPKRGHYVYLVKREKSSEEKADPPRHGTVYMVHGNHVLISPSASERNANNSGKYYKARKDNVLPLSGIHKYNEVPVTIKKKEVTEDQRSSDYKLIKYRADDGTYHWRKVKKVIDLATDDKTI